jgi:plastocyanin
MRLITSALLASAFMLGACGGGEKAGSGDTATTTPPPATTTPPGGTATAAPITGTTHEVKMVATATGFEYQPKDLTIKQGDGVKFTIVSGVPHNVVFDPAGIPDAAARSQLNANMPNAAPELNSPLMQTVGESYTVSFGNIPAGKYPYFCTPHIAMGMTGTITVQ